MLRSNPLRHVATDEHITRILRLGFPAFGFTSTLPPDQAAAVIEAIESCAKSPSGACGCGRTSATSWTAWWHPAST